MTTTTGAAATRGSQDDDTIIEDGHVVVRKTCLYCTEEFWINEDDTEAAATGCCPDCVGQDRAWKVVRRRI
jgi:hypothetical protein